MSLDDSKNDVPAGRCVPTVAGTSRTDSDDDDDADWVAVTLTFGPGAHLIYPTRRRERIPIYEH